jgi:hypothetical protein
MVLGRTKPLLGVFLRGKRRSTHGAENLVVICEPTVEIMWEPRHPTVLWVLTAGYMDKFTIT